MTNYETLVTEFETFLTKLKKECNKNDNLYFTIPDKIKYVKNIQNDVFTVLSEHWEQIWNEVKGLESCAPEYTEKRALLTEKLKPYFNIGFPNTRVYDKPLGYNGDYLTIYQYCVDYMGDSVYDILINQYSRSIPSAMAHKNRFPYLKNKFAEFKGKKIISLGCGPSVELLQFSEEQPEAFKDLDITLLDMEQQALDFVKGRLPDASNVNYLLYPIRNLLADAAKSQLKLEKYDFIYCFGLFDYLTDNVIKALIPALSKCLNDSGKLIVTNVHEDVTERGYFEFFADWKMYLRNEDNFIGLTQDITGLGKTYIDNNQPTPDNIYLVVEKD